MLYISGQLNTICPHPQFISLYFYAIMLIMWGIIISVLIFSLLASYIGVVRHTFKQLKNRIQSTLQEISNQLKKQADLIPELDEAVKNSSQLSSDISSALSRSSAAIETALASPTDDHITAAITSIGEVLSGIRSVGESSPQLLSDADSQELIKQFEVTADKTALSRHLLIDLVAQYNKAIITAPSSIVAAIFNLKPEESFT
ncbi:LemA family protein [Microgenomates group bacterium]|nr:LemA family protein [Microgenomates group bacterium]